MSNAHSAAAKKRWRQTDLERFTSKYSVNDETGCWVWCAATVGLDFNYGKFWINGKYDKAHRAAYMLLVGDIPYGMWVLHKCDNPSCVNPGHLFLGTRQDNVNDMLSKGRNGQHKNPPRGERKKDSKLKGVDVLDIRSRCADGETQSSVGKLYGIAQTTVSKIINRQRWAHI